MGIFGGLTGRQKLNVITCDSFQSAPNNELFRLPKDPENTIRIRQDYFINSPKQWDTVDEFWGLHVAGVSHREPEVESFIYGNDRKIKIVPQPTQKHPHALAVFGSWYDYGQVQKESQLGFVPDGEARDIYKQTKRFEKYLLAGKLLTMYIPQKDKNAGLVIGAILYEPRWPRFEIHGFGKKSGRKRKKTFRAKTFENALEKAYADDMIVDIEACREIN